ncbi:hypothetical protein [Neoactinobaculum massilliense]|uniref:aldose epimerase family protein n=1 Tax=Neoactinobaculum massilliense TaxID=2364794 RepID=UPI0013DE6DC0|nr:hypothetical protein [Neoactinobaculum massilliense]
MSEKHSFITIAAAGFAATVALHGARLCSLTHDGEDLIVDAVTRLGETVVSGAQPRPDLDRCEGQVLLPWPNRVRDGQFAFRDHEYRLPLNEAELGNAIHGFVRDADWAVSQQDGASVTLTLVTSQRPDWPGRFRARVTYALSETGLTVTVSVENVGEKAFPVGFGAHPYVTFNAPIDGARVSLRAGVMVETDERNLPVRTAPVAGTKFDFSSGRTIGTLTVDNAFRLEPAGQPWKVQVELDRAGDTARRTVWGSENLPWCQLFVPPARDALAVEPNSCAADALNSPVTHADLVALEPNTDITWQWGMY